jgi:hypothetical protein
MRNGSGPSVCVCLKVGPACLHAAGCAHAQRQWAERVRVPESGPSVPPRCRLRTELSKACAREVQREPQPLLQTRPAPALAVQVEHLSHPAAAVHQSPAPALPAGYAASAATAAAATAGTAAVVCPPLLQTRPAGRALDWAAAGTAWPAPHRGCPACSAPPSAWPASSPAARPCSPPVSGPATPYQSTPPPHPNPNPPKICFC